MNPIVIDKKEDKVIILQRGSGPKLERLFFQAIQQMWEEGYYFPDEVGHNDLSLRNFRGSSRGRAVMFKKAKTEKVVQPKVEVKKEKEDKAPKKVRGSSKKDK